jgi:hypothetical protein
MVLLRYQFVNLGSCSQSYIGNTQWIADGDRGYQCEEQVKTPAAKLAAGVLLT